MRKSIVGGEEEKNHDESITSHPPHLNHLSNTINIIVYAFQ
jgi:hypothetical protein